MSDQERRERLTAFVYLLTRDLVPWGDVRKLLDDHMSQISREKYLMPSSRGAWDMAQAMAYEILDGGKQ